MSEVRYVGWREVGHGDRKSLERFVELGGTGAEGDWLMERCE